MASGELFSLRRLSAIRTRYVRGFTLIELMVVLAIVATLLTIAVARSGPSIDASKEAVLRENLRTTRDVIARFYGDNGRYPDALNELVDKRYLSALPYDPVAETAVGWIIVPPPVELKGLVYDIRSAASGTTRSGRPFRDL